MADRVTRRPESKAPHPVRGQPPGEARSAKTILGSDPGLDQTGYAVIEAPGGRLVDAGLIRSATGTPLAERLHEIDGGVEEVLSEHQVDLLVIEDLFAHYRHPRTAILMGHARGVICLAAASAGLVVTSYNATQVKKILTGNGRAPKSQMQRAVCTELGLDRIPEPHDVADALAIALCHYYSLATRRALAGK